MVIFPKGGRFGEINGSGERRGKVEKIHSTREVEAEARHSVPSVVALDGEGNGRNKGEGTWQIPLFTGILSHNLYKLFFSGKGSLPNGLEDQDFKLSKYVRGSCRLAFDNTPSLDHLVVTASTVFTVQNRLKRGSLQA